MLHWGSLFHYRLSSFCQIGLNKRHIGVYSIFPSGWMYNWFFCYRKLRAGYRLVGSDPIYTIRRRTSCDFKCCWMDIRRPNITQNGFKLIVIWFWNEYVREVTNVPFVNDFTAQFVSLVHIINIMHRFFSDVDECNTNLIIISIV